jgi:predicted PurR-regulated permease PerM
MIERQTVELPPVLTICSQLALALLVGAVGLILATPILAVVMVLVQTLYIQDVLGDKNTEVNENLEQNNNDSETVTNTNNERN